MTWGKTIVKFAIVMFDLNPSFLGRTYLSAFEFFNGWSKAEFPEQVPFLLLTITFEVIVRVF